MFALSRASVRSVSRSALRSFGAVQTADKHTLILVRHGESTWNLENKFTGWYDCPLSDKGHEEVKEAGRLIKAEGLTADVAFTSLLQRAIRTLWHVLEQTGLMWIPVHKAWELNERHYGALQGLDKQETVNKYGKDQVLVWRRSYDIPPPTVDKSSPHHPSNDPRYAGFDFPEEFTESLATTLDRVVPFWNKTIVPEIKSGKTVMIAAHGNSLRALVKHLDGIDEATIAELNIPTGTPLIYELDDNLKPIPQAGAIAPLQGRYLGDQDAIRARIEGVKNQTK
ncbi:2,3-bisphosphoglycerate-dependent phosphoglycerate mutase [Fistulifera solaris]|uniref:Phosphoglycerate mutase n=1 Tax=Fistulifera solaris TaxID=1519565 RepID=A0A1Z5JEE9_FISSO|nr:2,3-bisphosphoglycerate-dependent phosphoglycerate mutase [Fistulifera solaris]|eukprot:GAX12380.1 2,3-bisphosphoglycerate-dependent phosphoglycerate mutase [Fistulifera solaris]